MLWQIWPKDFPRLAAHTLHHDVPEAWVGDVPAPTKRYNKAVRDALHEMEATVHEWLGTPNADDLPPEDKAKIKACDQLEIYLWAREQLAAGNMHVMCVVREFDRFFTEAPLPREAALFLDELRAGPVVHATDELIFSINGGKV